MKVAASLRLMTRSQLFWHSLSHIRRFSLRRMTKRGDAQRPEDRSHMSDVSSSNPWLLIPAFKLQGTPHERTLFS